ncbi:MOSC domain-containing protein [Pseudoduganella plicata]|nr:MOSC domain-containing protein [Pseudoduganella plicata]
MKPLDDHPLPECHRTMAQPPDRTQRSPGGGHGTPDALGPILALTVRRDPSAAPHAVAVAHAVAGAGLDSDMHADALSPRQVLLAGAPAYRRHDLAPGTMRENILLDVDTATLASGTLLQLGASVIVQLMFHCEACGYLDARSPGLARAIGRERGVLARVLRGGAVHEGDSVRRLATTLAPWPDDWRDRVARILAQVPDSMVVEYRQLARLAGIQAVYCRALPALARKLGFANRAVAQHALPELPRWLGETVFD